jgi:hypothetical protein
MSTIKLLPGMESAASFVRRHMCGVPGCDCPNVAEAELNADRAQWAAEIERVTELGRGHIARATRLEAERDEGRAALKKYGKHTGRPGKRCVQDLGGDGLDTTACHCGLNQALALAGGSR